MRKSLSSLYLISNDKLLDISIINYYFFNKNICIYECFDKFCCDFISKTRIFENLIAVFERKLTIKRYSTGSIKNFLLPPYKSFVWQVYKTVYCRKIISSYFPTRCNRAGARGFQSNWLPEIFLSFVFLHQPVIPFLKCTPQKYTIILIIQNKRLKKLIHYFG